MKIALFGATGGTGAAFAEMALTAGHEVAALVRNPARLAVRHDNLSVYQGDALDTDAVQAVIEGAGAVVSSLGTRPWRFVPICSRATDLMIAAMEANGPKRLICVSSYGVGQSRAHAGWLMRRLFFGFAITRELADKEIMERAVRASSLSWTIVRPVLLTSGPLTVPWHADVEGPPSRLTVSRRTVASFMVRELTEPSYIGRTVLVSK